MGDENKNIGCFYIYKNDKNELCTVAHPKTLLVCKGCLMNGETVKAFTGRGFEQHSVKCQYKDKLNPIDLPQLTIHKRKYQKKDKKYEESLTVPKKEVAPKLPSIKKPKNAHKNKKEVTSKLDVYQSAKSKEHPFHEGYGDKILIADCNRIAFGFWKNDQDEDDNFWCLVKLIYPSVGFPGRLSGAYKEEYDYLKEHGMANKNTIIIDFFEESNKGEKWGFGALSTNHLDKDSLRRVSSVKQLKEYKDNYYSLLSDKVKEKISKESMHIVDQMTLANNLSKYEEIEKAYLGTDK